MVRRLAVAALCLVAVGCAKPLVVKDVEATTRSLERQWERIAQMRPRMGVRELFGFALEAASVGYDPETVAKVLDLAEQMQDRDETSRTYGNFKWYWDAERPVDRNAVEFSMQHGILVWMLYRDRLNAAGVERLERLIRFSVEGIRRHGVNVAYTNIYLMKIWNCIAIGEATGRPALAEEGYQMLDQWLLYTWESGIHEYGSPTYYGTDLDSLALIAKFARRRDGRRKAEAALRLFWTDIAANWFEPCQRLGGAHSRDYDYLTGHGYLDTTLRAVGWLDDDRPVDNRTFFQLCRWEPPARIRRSIEGQVPRMVRQRWGAAPWERAAHYVGRRFSIGSAGATYGPMDKPLVVNLAGGPKQPVISFFMDARGDPYGKKRFAMGQSGHSKALHIQPFLTSVQRGPEVLLFACADPEDRMFKVRAPEPTCLLSHVILPADVDVWVADGSSADLVTFQDGGGRLEIGERQVVCLRADDVAVGIRFLVAENTRGRRAPVALVRDGGKYSAMRLTCTHSAQPPSGKALAAVYIRAAEGLDDQGFGDFCLGFGPQYSASFRGDTVAVSVVGAATGLRVAADLAKRQRLAWEGEEKGAEDALLMVNGRDYGREILDGIEPIRRYRRILAAVERGGKGAARAGEVVEAEAAALVIPPFRLDTDAKASGGRFLWMPGEAEGKGGSRVARALWLVHVPKAGAYYLWGRIQAPTPSDDSFFVRVRQDGRDALPRTDWHTGLHETWQWTQLVTTRDRTPQPIALAAGVALIEFHCREDGTRLDALCLTDDPDASPAETGGRP